MSEGQTYVDGRGWQYRVMGGIGGSFKARYLKPGASIWKGVAALEWRGSFEEAQADLDRMAQAKGWEAASCE